MFRSLGTKWSVSGSVLVFLAYYCLDQMVSGWFSFGLLASVGGSLLAYYCLGENGQWVVQFWYFGIVWTKWSVGGSVLVLLAYYCLGENGQWVVQFWSFGIVWTKWSVGGSVLVLLAYYCLAANGQWVVQFWSFGIVWTKWSVTCSVFRLIGPSGQSWLSFVSQYSSSIGLFGRSG